MFRHSGFSYVKRGKATIQERALKIVPIFYKLRILFTVRKLVRLWWISFIVEMETAQINN